ncbi:NUDIX hydrolase domain-like protein [Hysterangium stoloniferum]|nr:NUDIX hydrolase domain-like protein [Hysterangium stoloniferum]
MGKGDTTRPRVVCCAIPVARAAGKVLVITSRKRQHWVFPKGGWEPTDKTLEAAAQREAFEEAGVYGTITRYVTTIPSPTATYHFYELDVTGLLDQWPEAHERRREWVDFGEGLRRCQWKPELAQALMMTSFAPR